MQQLQASDKWISADIAARRLGISLASVYRLLKEKKIPYSQNGPRKGLKILESDLTRYALSKRVIPKTEITP